MMGQVQKNITDFMLLKFLSCDNPYRKSYYKIYIKSLGILLFIALSASMVALDLLLSKVCKPIQRECLYALIISVTISAFFLLLYSILSSMAYACMSYGNPKTPHSRNILTHMKLCAIRNNLYAENTTYGIYTVIRATSVIHSLIQVVLCISLSIALIKLLHWLPSLITHDKALLESVKCITIVLFAICICASLYSVYNILWNVIYSMPCSLEDKCSELAMRCNNSKRATQTNKLVLNAQKDTCRLQKKVQNLEIQTSFAEQLLQTHLQCIGALSPPIPYNNMEKIEQTVEIREKQPSTDTIAQSEFTSHPHNAHVEASV